MHPKHLFPLIFLSVFVLLLNCVVADERDWLVWPSRTASVSKKNQIAAALEKTVGKQRVEASISQSLSSTRFWLVKNPTVEERGAIKSIKAVDYIQQNKIDTEECGISNAQQLSSTVDINSLNKSQTEDKAPWELRMLSYPPRPHGPPDLDLDRYPYQYETSTRFDTFVYVIGRGVKMSHWEFTSKENPPTRGDWIFVGNVDKTYQDQSQKHGHTSCVASKALGGVSGVARSARLIPVKINYEPSGFEQAFSAILDDVVAKYRAYHSVIVLPVVTGPANPDRRGDEWNLWDRITDYLRELSKLKVPLVVPAGNAREKSGDFSNRLPAILRVNDDSWEMPLVSGAVDQSGIPASFSQRPGAPRQQVLTYWAPGVDLLCPDLASDSSMVYQSGTSFSAPMVAGLISYIQGITSHLYQHESSWLPDNALRAVSKNSAKHIIWNGELTKPLPSLLDNTTNLADTAVNVS